MARDQGRQSRKGQAVLDVLQALEKQTAGWVEKFIFTCCGARFTWRS